MAWLLGDSYGQLGNQALAEEQNRRLALGQAMNNFQQGAAQAWRRREIAQELALRERAINEEKVRWAQEFKARQDEIARQVANDTMRNQIAQGYLDWQRGQQTPAQVRSDDFRFKQVQDLATTGQLDSEGDAAKLLPDSLKGFAGYFHGLSQQANDQMEQQHKWAEMHAGLVNRYLDNQDQLATLQENYKALPYIERKLGSQRESALAKSIEGLNKQQAQLQPFYAQSINMIKSSPLFAPDPASGRVQSLAPPSPRMQREQMLNFASGFNLTDTGTAPSPIRAAPAAPAPSAGPTGPTPTYPDEIYGEAADMMTKAGINPAQSSRAEKAQFMQRAVDNYNTRRQQLMNWTAMDLTH